VVEPGDDFDDIPEDTLVGPLLPPEDRLWRHPSELGQSGQSVSAEALSARRSWMAATPSRAGAWSAGLVGAVLATGVVLVGGHLTHLLSPPAPKFSVASIPTGGRRSNLRVVTTSTIAKPAGVAPATVTTSTIAPLVEPVLSKLASRVTAAMPVVLDGKQSGVGVVISPQGYLLVPASLVSNANDITVDIDSQQLVANLVGVDSGSGLAVIRVHADDILPVASFMPDATLTSGAFVALVWVGEDGAHTCWGTVSALDVPVTYGSPPLLESLQALDKVPGSANGSVVIDGDGHLIGMVTSVAGKSLVATPGWLVDVVSRDLIATGRVEHGWLGIKAETVSIAGDMTAVKIISVEPNSAAAKAGMKPGDLIREVNGVPVKTMADMLATLYSMPPEQSIMLNIVRKGHAWAAHARLAAAA